MSFIFIILLYSKSWSQDLFRPILDNVTCEIDSKLAREWAKAEIKIYFENKSELLDEVDAYFDQTQQGELNRRCHEFVDDTMTTSLKNVGAINPALIAKTFNINHSKLKIQFVNFCESAGVYLYAGACFKKFYLFKTNEIQISSFNQGISIRMFFPQFKYRIENFKPVLAFVHEFFHYLEWDNQFREKHENPYAFESDDSIYSCTNMAFPGQSMVFNYQQKSLVLQRQSETCRNLGN